jgi:ferredoxin
MREGVPILDNHAPKEFRVENGRLTAVVFERMRAEYDGDGKRRLVPAGEAPVVIECDDVLMAIGQDNAFPWIERDIGLDFDARGMPVVDSQTFASTLPGVFFGGDAAWGPKNIIWAVAHGHQAAISIDLHCRGEALSDRPPPHTNLASQKMGIHEWSYDNDVSTSHRVAVPHVETRAALKSLTVEVELGYDEKLAFQEAMRCLNCDVQTVFAPPLCIECDACADICPVDCINFIDNAPETQLRESLRVPARNLEQDLLVSSELKTGRVMVKDEDVCLHCGLCAERCPTGAWDMQKYIYWDGHAGHTREPAHAA